MASTNAYRRGPFISRRGSPLLSGPKPLRENPVWPVLPWTHCPVTPRTAHRLDEAPLHELRKKSLGIALALACRTPARSRVPILDSALALTAQSERQLHRALSRGEMRIHAW